MMTLDEYLFSSKDQLDAALSGHIAQRLNKAIEATGKATLILSGGNTPKDMLNKLSRHDIAWKQVVVFLADERWVAPDTERSNEKMIRDHFLVNSAAEAIFEGLFVPKLDVKKAPVHLEEKLKILNQPADVLILGMGEDGHTASLFPCAENIGDLLSSKNQLTTVVVEPQTAPDARISLSFPVLTNSANIFVHFTGDLKKEIFQKISSGQLDAPIGHVLAAAAGTVQLYWTS